MILDVVGELQRKLYEQATTDPLTGALNRRQMSVSLAEAIEQSRRGGHAVSLLVFDLDHFKRVNDGHGHAAGDETLQRLVGLVRERGRRRDCVRAAAPRDACNDLGPIAARLHPLSTDIADVAE